MIRGEKTAKVIALSALLLAFTSPTVVNADRFDHDENDDENTIEGTVSTTVLIEGDSISGGSFTQVLSIPAKCWWSTFQDDDQFYAWWYIWRLNPIARLFLPPDEDVLEVLNEEDELEGRWYRAECAEGEATFDNIETFLGACQEWYPDACIPQLAVWWEDNESEPPVVIQPEELALAASALIEIPTPEVDQNPKMAGTENTTLVNFPTGFWVTDPNAVGGDDGLVELRATIPETGTWVEIWAETDGLSVTSPVGSTQCSPIEASTPWSEGEDPACAIEFARASTQFPEGFPVTAQTIWQTGWRGGINGAETDSGDLDPITAEETFNVPVAEMQTTVRP